MSISAIGAALESAAELHRDIAVLDLVRLVDAVDANAVRAEGRIRVRPGADPVPLVLVAVCGVDFLLSESAARQAVALINLTAERIPEADPRRRGELAGVARRIRAAAADAAFAVRTAAFVRGAREARP